MRKLSILLLSVAAFGQTTAINGWGGGASTGNIITKSADYTLLTTDATVICNAASGAVTLTLPAAPAKLETHVIKKGDATTNKCVVNGNGNNIDAVASVKTTAPFGGGTVQYDGSAWWVTSGSLSNGYTYYQLYVTAEASGSNCSIAELKFYDASSNQIATAGGTASASSTNSTFVAGNAFDGNSSTFWDSSAAASVGSPITVEYQFASLASVASFSITSRPDSFYTETPTSFQLRGSDDGTSWTTLGTFTAATWTASSQVQTFTLP